MGKISTSLAILLAARSTLAAPTTDTLVGRSQLAKRAVIGTTFVPEWAGGVKIPYNIPEYIDEVDNANAATTEACAAYCYANPSCNFALRVFIDLVDPLQTDRYYCLRYTTVIPKADANFVGNPAIVNGYSDIQTFSRNGPDQDITDTGKTLSAITTPPGVTPAYLLATKRSDTSTGLTDFDSCKQFCRDYRRATAPTQPCVAVQFGTDPSGLLFCDLFSQTYDPENDVKGDPGVTIYLKNSARGPSYWANI
ncbi:hypothetical protein Dda_6385 [Drechslerella dactyloides]|uniref:Apple domain-containing protein n=1 Tax=Drechslerella dactyloides TaxID=74499 RepID=A0AAD6IVF4_DREDA|nr:hypothetical protein Dda_6385 [Drechslerella dactyloides]